jgi:hypothetical protein
LPRYRGDRRAPRQQQDGLGAHHRPVRRHQRASQSLKLLPFRLAQLDLKVGLPHADHQQQLGPDGKVFD